MTKFAKFAALSPEQKDRALTTVALNTIAKATAEGKKRPKPPKLHPPVYPGPNRAASRHQRDAG